MRVAVRVNDLWYTYPDGTQALRGVSLSVLEGERVGLVGPNGAGKSTLLLHLNGLLKGSGDVQINGVPVKKPHLAEIRRRVGLVMQNPDDMLFCPTLEDDLAFGPLNMDLSLVETEGRIQRALSLTSLEGLRKKPPHHLSHGEKRRGSIAAVLVMEPEIIALDEPSSNLDPRGRRDLIAILNALDTTIILSSHDLELILAVCQRVVLLDEGQVIAEGLTPEILADEELMLAHGLERPHSLVPHRHARQSLLSSVKS